jgi:4-hydroxy-tetrahydrodipicolinate reductase
MSQGVLAVGIHGALGRMGTRLIQLIADDPALQLAAALEHSGHPRLGEDVGILVGSAPLGVAVSPSIPSHATIDVMIDFSNASASLEIAASCRERMIPLVVGTTGLDAAARQTLESSAARIPLLVAPNMSRAVNILMRLVDQAARSLGATADIEIIERHHRTKKDSPSGTALRLAEIAGQGSASSRLIPSQEGPSLHSGRPRGQIGIHALRIGDSPGEHTVVFGLMGETLELSHRAVNRDGFARGALDAAKFLAGKPAGLYSMEDVLAWVASSS